jgi:hypothetical protein
MKNNKVNYNKINCLHKFKQINSLTFKIKQFKLMIKILLLIYKISKIIMKYFKTKLIDNYLMILIFNNQMKKIMEIYKINKI